MLTEAEIDYFRTRIAAGLFARDDEKRAYLLASAAERLDLADIARLDFQQPDEQRFPALRVVREALARGGTAPAA